MHILLMKCHGASLLTRIRPIVTEPLELETIAAVLDEFSDQGVTYRIYDPWLEGGSPKSILRQEMSEVLILSGYMTAVDQILELAAHAKQRHPAIQVWVGGVHAEGCPEDFFSNSIDAVFCADALWGLTRILNARLKQGLPFRNLYETIPGLAFQTPKGKWEKTRPSAEGRGFKAPQPSRRYFEAHRRKIRYMERRGVALLKTALSCPHTCEFCYCRLLNGGDYRQRPLEEVVAELRGIRAETVWIVDDCFLTTADRAEVWVQALEGLAAVGIRKRFIAYARADAIVQLAAYLPRLRAVGFEEWIVGLEAVEDTPLRQLGKGLEAEVNARAVKVIRESGAVLTALFLVTPDDDAEAFRRLAAWIKTYGVRRFTLSILTPLKGTALYDHYAARMASDGLSRPARFDFLHLVMRPTRMPAWLFYWRFWRLSLRARLR